MRSSVITRTMAAMGGAAWGVVVWAQLGGLTMQEWSTSGGDAQRSSWIRKDPLISTSTMASGKFGLLWKLKVANQPRGLNTFSRAALVNNAMGYKGFRSLTVLAGASNTLVAIDNDFGVMYWEKHFDAAIPAASSAACPGGMTAAATRVTNPDPAALAGRGPVIRSPFRSALSEPGAGASVDSGSYLPGGGGRASAGRRGASPGGNAGRGAAQTRTGAQPIIALASDGVLHFVSPTTMKELLKPLPFIPANARATDLAAVNGMVYTATVNGCGGVPNAIWAIDPYEEDAKAISWKTEGESVAGTLAFGSDGTIYAAIGDSVVALDPKTLNVKDRFTQHGADFQSTPVVFVMGARQLLAVAAKDGRVFLLDTAGLGGVDHRTPLDVSPPPSASRPDVVLSALASWQDESGVRWLLTPSANGAIAAWKVSTGTKPSLQPGWVSRDLRAPLPPIVVNGIVFAAASGEYKPGDPAVSDAERVKRSSAATLYAFDGATGKEIWNSGTAITSFMHGGGLSASPGQIYLATADSTVYAFGMPYERQ